jgi:D-3-phosphoglycerate dehydrogenase
VCKQGVKLINVARGGIIDEKALLDAVNSGQCSGAALDVFGEEPPVDMKLIQHPSIICTPHLGANTREAQKRVAVELAQQIIDFKQGHSLIGVVNGSAVTSQFAQGNRPILLLSKRLGQIVGASSSSTPTQISLSFNRKLNFIKKPNKFMFFSCLIRYSFKSFV